MSAPTPIIFEVNGKTVSAIPCSKRHREYFEAGYLVLSCKKCTLEIMEGQ